MLNTQNSMAAGVIGILGSALTYILFGSFFQYLWFTWKVDPFYLHGLWIGILSLLLYGFFIWKIRHGPLLLLEKKDQFYSFLSLCFSFSFFILGAKTHLAFLGGLSFFCWALTFQFLFFQRKWWKDFTFPFVFFLLAVPLPYLGEFSGLLQIMVASLLQKIFSFFGYVLFQEGILLNLPNASFQIAADCTGIKSWLVLLSLVIFFLYFLKLNLKTKILIVVLVLPIAFISNFTRVFILIYLGFLKGEAFAMTYWHDWGGMVFYLLSCFLVLVVFGLALRYESSK